jgi:DNA-binding NarL/FixJ family response regulator
VATKAVQRIQVLLADDHTMLRAGTRRILEDERDIEVIGEASGGEEAVGLAERTQPDVVLLDISMPDGDGIAVFPRLREVAPHARVVILTAHAQLAYVRACARLGAAGFVLKSAEPRELVAVIRRVYAGETAFAAPGDVLPAPSTPSTPSERALTAREMEVIRLAAAPRTNREMAAALHVNEGTIEFHLRNIYTKLGAASRTEAVLIAQRLGWLDRPDALC